MGERWGAIARPLTYIMAILVLSIVIPQALSSLAGIGGGKISQDLKSLALLLYVVFIATSLVSGDTRPALLVTAIMWLYLAGSLLTHNEVLLPYAVMANALYLSLLVLVLDRAYSAVRVGLVRRARRHRAKVRLYLALPYALVLLLPVLLENVPLGNQLATSFFPPSILYLDSIFALLIMLLRY